MARNADNAPADDDDNNVATTVVLVTKRTFKTKNEDGTENAEKREATINVEMPTTVEAALSLFGEDTTIRLIRKSARLKAQQDIASKLAANTPQEQIQAEFSLVDACDFTRTVGKSTEEKASTLLGKLSPEARAALFAQYGL